MPIYRINFIHTTVYFRFFSTFRFISIEKVENNLYRLNGFSIFPLCRLSFENAKNDNYRKSRNRHRTQISNAPIEFEWRLDWSGRRCLASSISHWTQGFRRGLCTSCGRTNTSTTWLRKVSLFLVVRWPVWMVKWACLTYLFAAIKYNNNKYFSSNLFI